MGAFYETIPKSLIPWILQQKMIWVASSPLSGDGHVNVSPKGGEYFGVIDDKTFWYQDLTGSGVETISHLLEPGNGRITILLNGFEGPPRILRLWGRGVVLEYGTEGFNEIVQSQSIKTIPGTRAIVRVDIHQVGTSCGFSVPFYDFKEFRPTLNEFFEKRVKSEEEGNQKDGIERYWAYKNALSIDNLPGLRRGVATSRTQNVTPIKKMVGPKAPPYIAQPWKLLQSQNYLGTNLNFASLGSMLVSFLVGMLVAVFALEYARVELGVGARRMGFGDVFREL